MAKSKIMQSSDAANVTILSVERFPAGLLAVDWQGSVAVIYRTGDGSSHEMMLPVIRFLPTMQQAATLDAERRLVGKPIHSEDYIH
jgi:hypothetical protein